MMVSRISFGSTPFEPIVSGAGHSVNLDGPCLQDRDSYLRSQVAVASGEQDRAGLI